MIRHILSTILILIWVMNLSAQPGIQWQRTYGWEDRQDVFQDIYLTEAGNYACCGESRMRNNAAGWLLLASDEGEPIFSRRYNTEHNESFASLVETDDGGFFMGGRLYTQESRIYVFAVMTDGDGEEIWQRRIAVDDNDDSMCNAVIEAKSGIYLMTGNTRPDPNSLASDGFLLALNSEGDLLWERTYHEGGHQELHAIREVEEGFLLAGYVSQDGNNDFWLVKTDEEGLLIWSRDFGEDNRGEYSYSLISCNEGGWAMGGFGGSNRPMIARLNRQAQLGWMRIYERGEIPCIIRSIVQTEDNGFALVGYLRRRGELDHAAFILKISNEGNEMWRRTDRFDYHLAIPSSTILSNGGSIVYTGQAWIGDYREGPFDIAGLIVKLIPEFSPPEIVEYAPEKLELNVLQGDSIFFAVSAIDLQDDSLSYFWRYEDDPVSTDTSVTIHFDELGDFNVTCIVSDGELADSVRWRIHVVEFYIDGFDPDTLEMTVRRNQIFDYSIDIRASEDAEYDLLWTLIGRGGEREIGEEEAVSVQFDLTGDHRLTGMVYGGGRSDAVEWIIHVRSVVWWWYPLENELSLRVESSQEFAIYPFNTESDSLSYRWFLNDDLLEFDTTTDLIEYEFSEVGLQTMMSIVHDGAEVDTVVWEVEVYDPNAIIDRSDFLPQQVSLSTPKPNPFNVVTRIDYALPEPGNVNLEVYDIGGGLVGDLVDKHLNAGRYSASFDASELPAGLYFVRLEVGGLTLVRKAVVVK